MSNLSFLFPGQGSQDVTMLSDMMDAHPELCDTFEEASDVLGFNVFKAMRDADKVNQTEYTQPILLTASVALYRLWVDNGGKEPSVVAGHSLGEYSALCCAGAVSFSQALEAVRARGEYMQSAVAAGIGAMAAIIGPSDEEVEALCRRVGSEGMMISPANYNAKGQVVVAGHVQAIKLIYQLGQQEGFKVIPLPVSVPSHCVLMTPAAKQLQQLFKHIDFAAPKIPVLHNVDVVEHTDPDDIKNTLISQLTEPVLWSQTMNALHERGVTDYVECGSGSVLSGLGRRQENKVKVVSLSTPEGFVQALG